MEALKNENAKLKKQIEEMKGLINSKTSAEKWLENLHYEAEEKEYMYCDIITSLTTSLAGLMDVKEGVRICLNPKQQSEYRKLVNDMNEWDWNDDERFSELKFVRKGEESGKLVIQFKHEDED